MTLPPALRAELLAEWQSGQKNLDTLLLRTPGISRTALHRWLDRAQKVSPAFAPSIMSTPETEVREVLLTAIKKLGESGKLTAFDVLTLARAYQTIEETPTGQRPPITREVGLLLTQYQDGAIEAACQRIDQIKESGEE